MTEILGAWVRTLAVGAMFCGAVLALTPEGSEKRAVKLVCGAALTLLLLAPLRDLDAFRLPELTVSGRVLTERLLAEAEAISEESRLALIRAETEEYIWDASRSLGIARLGIRLDFDWEGDIPVPRSISLRGSWTEEQRTRLSLLLGGELGIPASRQEWSPDIAD